MDVTLSYLFSLCSLIQSHLTDIPTALFLSLHRSRTSLEWAENEEGVEYLRQNIHKM